MAAKSEWSKARWALRAWYATDLWQKLDTTVLIHATFELYLFYRTMLVLFYILLV